MTNKTNPELVKRLRAQVPYQGKSAQAFLCHEAADAIEALQAREAAANAETPQDDVQDDAPDEITRLKRQLAAAKATYDTIEAELTANERMVETLQFALRDAVSTATENARLRDEAKEQAERLAAVLVELVEQCWRLEKDMTEFQGHTFCGESLPLCNARAALAAWEKSRG